MLMVRVQHMIMAGMSDPRETVRGMETTRYLDCLAADYTALRVAAVAAGMDAPVPSCPGWTVADLVEHTATVYLHKAAIMRDQAWPRPWPPDLTAEGPAAALDRGYREVTAEFAARGANGPAPTFYQPDQTVGFWIRRMAQESVIHRIDAELAAGGPVNPVPGDLAIDGVDEALRLFLAYGSTDWPEGYGRLEGGHLAGDDGTDTITVTTGSVSWTVQPTPKRVTVTDGGANGARAVIEGEPEAVLRWLWGRASDSAVTVAGDPTWADYLRRLMVAVTQ
jgi:uncharacterized protein (TIGR03083 family)